MSSPPRDPFQHGVQTWLRSMESSRRALEDLGRTMGESLRVGAPVTAADLERVVQALALIERASVHANERIDALEQRSELLSGRCDALQEQLVTLTGAVSTLVDRVLGGSGA